jgi:Replication-relaxation
MSDRTSTTRLPTREDLLNHRRDHVVLRDHLVRLIPTNNDLDDRIPILLTARDWEILTAIDLHGYLTLDLIDLAFFPSARTDERPSTRAHHRLHQLWLWGFVERIERPVARVIGGRRPFLYALSQRGLRLLEERSSSHDASPHRRRLDRTSELFVEHSLTVAAVWANVLALLRPRPITLGAWVAERDLRARQLRVKDRAGGRWLPFLPDGYFELHYASGRVQCCLLEVDLGTHSLKAMHRKLGTFELFLAEGLFARTWKRDDFEVLIVAPSEQRLQNVLTVSRKSVKPDRWDAYLFTTLDVLQRSRFGEAEWRCLDGSTFGLLFADASESTSGSRSLTTP